MYIASFFHVVLMLSDIVTDILTMIEMKTKGEVNLSSDHFKNVEAVQITNKPYYAYLGVICVSGLISSMACLFVASTFEELWSTKRRRLLVSFLCVIQCGPMVLIMHGAYLFHITDKIRQDRLQRLFLDASTHLYKRVCPSVCRSVGPSVRNAFFQMGEMVSWLVFSFCC